MTDKLKRQYCKYYIFSRPQISLKLFLKLEHCQYTILEREELFTYHFLLYYCNININIYLNGNM